ncbi:MAG TPA: hypothetical protein PKD20_00345 [Candidatus Saccharibacteria bacterium]|jgi:hypothetical protein|nr:hypothetical protein [Candidatus Saccharibacteria bacterium]HMT55306.1 hypothetical protein [Candidatus Saccharibacteria bacterium]
MLDAESVLGVWPLETREPARELVNMFGEPDEVTIHTLTWNGVEPWKYIKINRAFTEHNFPYSHVDCVEVALFHYISADDLTRLVEFHGGISYVKTLSELRVYCKNLPFISEIFAIMHDLLTKKATVQEARKHFTLQSMHLHSSVQTPLPFLPKGKPCTDEQV